MEENSRITEYPNSRVFWYRQDIVWDIIQHKLPELKKEFNWLKDIGSQSLQMEIRHLDVAFKNFFRSKKGFPNFKKKHNNHKSFQIPSNSGNNYEIKNDKLYIPKLKTGNKIKQHRKFNGKQQTITISSNPSGQYFVTILVETVDNLIKPKKINEKTTIGIDLGLKEFLITSNGEKVDNPKFLKKSSEKLKREQKKLSRKNKGSNNKNKQRVKVAKIHNKISNQRNDFHHKISSKIISENQTICLEDLNVKGMMKNHKLSKSISDVGWSSFINKLLYKADWHGVNLITIGRFKPSTKLCSSCGMVKEGLTLKIENGFVIVELNMIEILMLRLILKILV